jgi:glutamyl-tRNA reductase
MRLHSFMAWKSNPLMLSGYFPISTCTRAEVFIKLCSKSRVPVFNREVNSSRVTGGCDVKNCDSEISVL